MTGNFPHDKLVKGLGESHDSELKNLIPLLSRPQRRGSHALDYTFGIWLVIFLIVGDHKLGSFEHGVTSFLKQTVILNFCFSPMPGTANTCEQDMKKRVRNNLKASQ